MNFRSLQIVPPKEWGVFEDLCHALFKRVWNDALAQKNGRRGQAQAGVDIFGSLNGVHGRYRGVQCKGKDRHYGSKATWAEIEQEIFKAEAFSPPLEEWIFATTAPVDATLQKRARETSRERAKKGAFGVHVLGWDEILALLAEAPDVVAEFYPEYGAHLPSVVRELRGIQAQLSLTADRLNFNEKRIPSSTAISAWGPVTFGIGRGLGPALMGYSLGPSDASACPTLTEVSAAVAQLEVGYSVRLVGEPGAGKSICSYQVAAVFAERGYEVYHLLDPESTDVTFPSAADETQRLFLIDDAHLLSRHALDRLERLTDASCLLLSNLNTVDQAINRGVITLDSKRAVRTIASSMRANMSGTLAAVRLSDDQVGDRMVDSDIGERLDHAEESADRPWQFCFILGGGWRRAKQAADAARAFGADLTLAAVSIRQLISRDARATVSDIASICDVARLRDPTFKASLQWLVDNRLIVSGTDYRTPHQRFASVVLHRILEGQDQEGRVRVASMISHALQDKRFPYAGIRALVHELRFGSDYCWDRLIPQAGISGAVNRCWEAEGSDRGAAALALSELWEFSEGGAAGVIGDQAGTLGRWISNPNDGAYGFGHLLNSLAQRDKSTAVSVVKASDPESLGEAYSNATPETAFGLADLLRSVAYVGVDEHNDRIRASLDRDKLRSLATHEDFRKKAFIFATFCASVLWWDKDLTIEMAELFIPTARRLLADDPIDGFCEISHDFASTVLRVFDVLGVYVGKHKATPKQWRIARQICSEIPPTLVATQLASTKPRHFQSAAFFLHFLHQAAPRKYDAVVRSLEWSNLEDMLRDDWAHMPHDTEVLLGTLYSSASSRRLIQEFIASQSHRIVDFPPRLMLMAPNVGIEHISGGGSLRLAQHGHVSWQFGGAALAILAHSRPELVEATVYPHVDALAQGVTNYQRSMGDSAEAFVRIVIDHAPRAWHETLLKIDESALEQTLAKCLTMDEDHRRTAAAIIESVVASLGALGDVARRLRLKFPKASIAPVTPPAFRRRKYSRKKAQNAGTS